MKKKVLFLITKSQFGGAQRYVLDLAEAVKKTGHQVKVACGGEGPLIGMCRESDIEIFSIKSLKRDISLGKEILSLFQLFKVLAREKPDVLHVNSSKAGGLGAVAGRLAGVKKIVFTAHGLPQFEKRSFLTKKILAFFTWLTMILATDTILLSQHDVGAVKGWPFLKNKTHYIPNGLKSFETFPQQGARKTLGKPHPEILNKKILIGTIAELTPNKGLGFAIDALEKFLKERNAGLVIIGDGEEKALLQNLIKDKALQNYVFLVGFLDEAKKYLKAFDVFLLPSFKEGLPYVVLEAGLANIPVVASMVGGLPDILEEESLFEPGDKKGLVERLEQTLLEKDACAKNLHMKVTTKFSFDEMVRKTLALYMDRG